MAKKFFLVLCLLLVGGAVALADAGGTVIQTSCSIIQGEDSWLVYCYAEVYNSTENVLCLEEGSFDLFSGDQILATGEVTQMYPFFLGPYEHGYFFDMVVFEPDENGNLLTPNVTRIAYDVEYMTIDSVYASRLLSTDAKLNRLDTGSLEVEIEVENITEETVYSPVVAYSLCTSGGAMIYADGISLANIGIPSGDSVLVRFEVAKAFVNQWEAYGALPTEVNPIASFQGNED